MKRLTDYFKSLPFKTKSNIRVGLFFIVVLILSYILTSCSTTECLTEPNKNDLTIIWCDYDTLYTVNCYGKLVKVKNIDHEMYFVGDIMICKFR